ncbi:sesquipedalian-1 [Drosophila novamexicana]|uniref:sesquipedalian-1 n=1 Tax=Drosophila novamexicana TaxID=47314 RepID=UPI0011E59FFB|nr:sesquipedalian-1 [Drosophila novamexicana]
MKINEKNLCVFARSPPFDMEGFLNKRGEINKAFQRRYFVLKGNLLFYFETRLDKEPLGLIIVEGCTIELSQESDADNYCFEIAFNGNRTYILAADTQESMESWMKALTCAGYEYKRIIVAELQRQLQEIEDSRNKMHNDRRDPSQAVTDAPGKPKPPPRRQNPFNRPAPPPPLPPSDASAAAGLRGGVVMSPMPFIPGYFGSSNAKAQQELQFLDNGNGNGNGSPQSTPRAQRRQAAAGASPSIFYNDLPVATARSTVLASCNNNNNSKPIDRLEQQRRVAKAVEEFKRNHERFRQVVMPDIVAYRERRKQPLIQF